MKEAKLIWMDGELVPWADAKIHVLSHVVHYGSSVFDSMRCYETPKGLFCFRLSEHVKRLFFSAKIYRMEISYSREEIIQAAKDLLRENGLKTCYLRPLVYRGYSDLGVNPTSCPVCVMIAAWEWGVYLGEEGQENGIDVCVSSWQRLAHDTMPMLSKAGGHYLNNQLITQEAKINGYAEGIALTTSGFVSEGAGENIFIVKNGGLITPPTAAAILPGITRHSIITLAKERGVKVSRQMIPREGLYIADEAFLTGTAAEVTPVRSIDRIPVGDGKPGPVTKMLQDAFNGIITGRDEDTHGWMEPM
ncbi:MAG: branched-chain amino acid aminotransferase [Planctomycetes bacterium DG_58]|nr:MAG: branched-chain amino acid aminotransferase [Planctomycetes bacterium DG_58]KPL04519.1 MAG: branched-chain amino acid aminotransferase [Planctomycetes bacterium SM23_65]